jgi:hypothetical protein
LPQATLAVDQHVNRITRLGCRAGAAPGRLDISATQQVGTSPTTIPFSLLSVPTPLCRIPAQQITPHSVQTRKRIEENHNEHHQRLDQGDHANIRV